MYLVDVYTTASAATRNAGSRAQIMKYRRPDRETLTAALIRLTASGGRRGVSGEQGWANYVLMLINVAKCKQKQTAVYLSWKTRYTPLQRVRARLFLAVTSRRSKRRDTGLQRNIISTARKSLSLIVFSYMQFDYLQYNNHPVKPKSES